MSDYTGANIEGILAAVNAQLAATGAGFACELGGAAAAAHIAPLKVVWQPHPELDVTFEGPKMQPADGVVIKDALEPFLVHVAGADVGSARRMVDVLLVALDTLFGINAQVPVKMRPAPDRVTSTAFAYSLTMRLRVPVYRYRYGRETVLSTEVTGTAQTNPLESADPGTTAEIPRAEA